MAETETYCETFVRIAERFAEVYGAPLPKQLLVLGEDTTGMECKGWRVRLNTTGAPIDGVGAFNAHVNWNGWPAGVIDPGGGCIAAGDAANLETFMAWLPTATAPTP